MALVLKEESSLSDRRRKLDRERALLHRLRGIEWTAAGILLAAGAVRWAVRGATGLLWLGAAAAGIALAHEARRREALREARALAAGAGGERSMAGRLAAALPDDTLILNDLSVRHGRLRAQLDHLVLSPRGLFVLETKAWRGRLAGRAGDPEWVLESPRRGRIRVKNPVRQNRRQCEALRGLLGGGREPVGLVVMASRGLRIELEDGPPEGVVSPDEALGRILAHVPERGIPPDEIGRILERLGCPRPP